VGNFIFSVESFLTAYSWLGIPLSFLGGILLSLSPCVLPILPVALSIIGEASLATETKTSFLSLVFVLGVATTYVILGLIAGLFGIFLGSATNSFFVYLILGIVWIILGLSFFDIFKLPIFNVSYNPKKNLLSLFILGVVSGLSMIPCAFPILGAILSLISIKKNLFYGVACLLSFSLGYATVLFIVGESAVFLRRLSKSYLWFIIVKRILGLVLLIIGLYFIVNVIILI